MLTEKEKDLARLLAAGDKTVVEACRVIFHAHIEEHVDGGRKSVEMNFLSEVFNVCPDPLLRAKYRNRILANESTGGKP